MSSQLANDVFETLKVIAQADSFSFNHFVTGDVHVRQKRFSIRRRETYIYVRVFCQKDGDRCFTLQSLR